MERFAALCRGDNLAEAPDAASNPRNGNEIRYWLDFECDYCVPEPRDLSGALDEVRSLRDRVLALPPPTQATMPTGPDEPTSKLENIPWLTVSQAADLVSLNRGVISRAADKKKIVSEGRGRARRIERESLLAWKQEYGKKRRKRAEAVSAEARVDEEASERVKQHCERISQRR